MPLCLWFCLKYDLLNLDLQKLNKKHKKLPQIKKLASFTVAKAMLTVSSVWKAIANNAFSLSKRLT